MNKKGNIFDLFEGVGWFFLIIIGVFVMYQVMSGFGTQMTANPQLNSTQMTGFYNSYQTKYVAAWDYGFLLMAILLPIFSFIAARKIPSDGIYMILMFFVIGFIFIALMIMSNVYGGMMDNATFAAFIAQTNYIPLLMPNLPYYGLFYMGLVMYALFSKTDGTR